MSDSSSRSHRFDRYRSNAPKRPPLASVLGATALLGIPLVLIGLISDLSGLVLLVPPIGASAALVIGAPELPLSQPRNVVLGHFAGVVTGIIGGLLAPGSLAVGGIAGALAFLMMLLMRAAHSPGVATAIMLVMLPTSTIWLTSMEILLCAIMVILVCWLLHRVRQVPYPAYWW